MPTRRKCDLTFQSTRPVRGGTYESAAAAEVVTISIHPPRAGRDLDNEFETWFTATFQSTRPVRGGTGLPRGCFYGPTDFNPPAPCGAGRKQFYMR